MSAEPLSSKYFLIKKASSSMFIAIIIASIIVSFSLVTLKLLWEQRAFNSKVHTAQEATRDVLIQNIANYEKLAEDYELVEEGEAIISEDEQGEKTNSAIILDALPSKYDFPAILTAMQNLASESGIALTSFNGDDDIENAIASDPNPTPLEITFSVSVEGSYTSLKNFLQQIERTIRPYYVSTINVSGSNKSLKVNIEMKTYYQPAIDITESVTEVIAE